MDRKKALGKTDERTVETIKRERRDDHPDQWVSSLNKCTPEYGQEMFTFTIAPVEDHEMVNSLMWLFQASAGDVDLGTINVSSRYVMMTIDVVTRIQHAVYGV